LLDETGLKVPVLVSLDDIDFVRPPVIKLLDPQTGLNGQLPHVLRADGTFCYLDGTSIVLDRYKPGQTIIQCLEQADKVLRDALRGRLVDDLANEFGAYWANGKVLVDLPLDFEGDAKIQMLRFDANPDNNTILVSAGKSPYERLHIKYTGKYPDAGFLCPVVRVPLLSFDPALPWPPQNLSDLNGWLKSMAPAALGVIETAFGRTKTGHVQWICLSAPNGRFFVSAEIAKAYRKPEFLQHRRFKMPTMLSRVAGAVKIARYVGVPVDSDYIFSRNLGRMKSLAGKRILLIGCGTVGGFLAQHFAQSGAGADGGQLTLVDPDILQGANMGRHLLGAPYLDRNKADACAEFLTEQLPLLDIMSIPHSILTKPELLDRQDLIVDATGEEALSIALNERAITGRPNFPPLLFVWIEGNGAAAVGFMLDSPDWACLKCLQPDLSGPKRFRLVRGEVEIESGRNLACGDAYFIPFPVSRAATAAGLACDMALDWANSDLRQRWRSVTMDQRKAFHIADINPKKFDHCPACGDALA